jgi:hypothetical protein
MNVEVFLTPDSEQSTHKNNPATGLVHLARPQAPRKSHWLHSAYTFPLLTLSRFYPSKAPSPHIRVSFSELPRDKAEEGFKRLAEALRHYKSRVHNFRLHDNVPIHKDCLGLFGQVANLFDIFGPMVRLKRCFGHTCTCSFPEPYTS